MTEELEPLDEQALAVLTQAAPVRELPEDVHARVWNAVVARAAMVQGGGGAGSSLAREPPRARPWGSFAKNPWPPIFGALLVGVALGAVLRGSPEVRVVTVDRPRPAPVSAIPTAPGTASGWAPVDTSPPLSTTAPPPAEKPPAPGPGGQELAAESAILDVARAAIARGEAEHALVAIERHVVGFPHGVLREEREALWVKALVLAGRGDDARARAARFRAHYPESLFLPAIESTLRSIP